MQKVFILFPALFLFTFPAFSQTPEDHLSKVKTRLEELGIVYEVRPFSSGTGTFLLAGRGQDEAAPEGLRGDGLLEARFVLVIPLPSSGYALETGLSFAEKTLGGDVPALLVFTGEEGKPGLEDLAGDAANPGDWILLYLDMPEHPQRLLLDYRSGSYTAPLSMLKPLYEAAFQGGFNPELSKPQKGGDPVLDFLWRMDINALRISGAAGGEGESLPGPEKLAELLAGFSQAPSLSISDPERNYGILNITRLTDKVFFITEKITILLILAALGLVFFALTAIFLFAGRLPHRGSPGRKTP